MVNGVKKGKRGEVAVCEILSQYFKGEFRRRGAGYKGHDLITPEYFEYCIEVKDEACVRLKHLWKETKKLSDYWKQATEQAMTYNKKPLLVVKIEGLWFCWTDWSQGASQFYKFEKWCEIYGTKFSG